jgi:mannose-6-phosphate isomerase-like protein (cupin superfamily)
MIKRRKFLRTSAFGLFGSTVISLPTILKAEHFDTGSLIKQPDQCETYFVRENTPITIHISRNGDNVSTVSICTEEIQAGSVIPTHKHINEDEYFYFISGSGIIIANDIEFPFKSGTSGFVPRNTWHSIKNTSTDKVLFQFGYTPSGFEDFFRQIGTPKGQQFKQKPKDEFDLIAKKYGMVFR